MDMEKLSFEEVFDSVIADKLLNLGFERQGKNIFFVSPMHAISLIRLGGRMSREGCISHTLCCRHTYLRNLNKELSQGFENDVFSYPIKLKPNSLRNGLLGLNIKYSPQNLNFEYEVYEFANKSEKEVHNYCEQTVKNILKIKKWFEELRPSKLASQISQNGTDAWIERLWIEDYKSAAI